MGIIRERDWIKYLPDEFTLYFSLKTLLGQIVSFSVVLIKDDQYVARYDTAHEFAHRDIMGRINGLIALASARGSVRHRAIPRVFARHGGQAEQTPS